MPNYDNSEHAALAAGRLYLGSTTELQPSTGESTATTLENPATSGVTLRVTRLVATASAGPVFPRLFKNPDTNTPSTTRDIMDANTETNTTSEATLKADTQSNDMSGGTDTGIEFGIQTGVTNKDGINVRIPPGGTLGLNVPSGGALVGESASINIWFEEIPRP